jgi:hypothetical protein
MQMTTSVRARSPATTPQIGHLACPPGPAHRNVIAAPGTYPRALIRRATATSQISDLQSQQTSLQAEEEKVTLASQPLQAKVDAFRTRKETIKAAYTAAVAETDVGEAISGISEEMGDIGMAMQRAQDKTEQMRARAGRTAGLRRAAGRYRAQWARGRPVSARCLTAGHDVDDELARMKAQLPASAAPPASEGPGTPRSRAERRLPRRLGPLEPWVRLDTLDSPHQSLVHPIVDYVRQAQKAGRQVAVLILEIQPRRRRYRILQNRRGLLLATVLRASTDVVICTTPYRLTTR